MSDSPADIPSLEARVEAMRRLGVLEWGDVKLGPAPQPEATPTTQQTETLEAKEQRARDDQRTLALAASSRLVRRLGENRKL